MTLHPGIVVSHESIRGCGFRNPGRMYLVSDGPTRGCGKLPIPLEVCPCCGGGIKPSRTPQWLETPERLWWDYDCLWSDDQCRTCPMSRAYETGPALLVWVGMKFYPTPGDFVRESRVMGISRFIQSVPKNFVLGETWVLLAHRKTIELGEIFGEPSFTPGIFGMFRPTRIEITVDGTEDHDTIDRYLERGLTPVMVVRDEDESTVESEQFGLWGDNHVSE